MGGNTTGFHNNNSIITFSIEGVDPIPVVRKVQVDSAISSIALPQKGIKSKDPGDIELAWVESDFNSKMLNFNVDFTSY